MTAGPPRGWLVFDVDDTLIATYRVGFRKCDAVARRLGLRPPTSAQFAARYGRMPFRECVAALHPGIDVDRYAAAYDALAAEYPPEPLCQLGPVLAGARAHGFGLGVLTNGPADKTDRKLRAVGVRHADFDFVCHADNSEVAKPHPAAFRRLVDGFGVDAARAWYVSDSPADWLGARRAGFATIGVGAGFRPDSSPPEVVPDLVVHDPGALVDLIGELAALADDPAPHERAPVAAVSFDAGFTLVEDVSSPEEIITRRLRCEGTDVAPDRLRAALTAAAPILADTRQCWSSDREIDRSLTAYYQDVIAAAAGRPADDAAAESIRAYTALDNWRVRPGAREALVAARSAGRRVGVLANWSSALPRVLSATGLGDLVDVAVASTEAGVGKPGAAAFATIAGRLGVTPAALAHVGDDPVTDSGGALRAGCRAAYLPRGGAAGALRTAVEVLCR